MEEAESDKLLIESAIIAMLLKIAPTVIFITNNNKLVVIPAIPANLPYCSRTL